MGIDARICRCRWRFPAGRRAADPRAIGMRRRAPNIEPAASAHSAIRLCRIASSNGVSRWAKK